MDDTGDGQRATLDPLFVRAREALAGADAERALSVFARLQASLEAHFEQEDALYFSAIGVLRPERRAVLERFRAAHAAFRKDFARISAALRAGSHDHAREIFEHFAAAFDRHELDEQELVGALEAEIASAR